ASLLRLRRCDSADVFRRSYTSSGMFFSVSVVGMIGSRTDATIMVPKRNLVNLQPNSALQRAGPSQGRKRALARQRAETQRGLGGLPGAKVICVQTASRTDGMVGTSHDRFKEAAMKLPTLVMFLACTTAAPA